MQKKLELIFKIIVGLTFFMPLVFLPKSFIFPFIVPKILFFRSLALVLLSLYLVLLAMDWEKYRPKKSWLTILVFLFIVSFAISTFFGVDWYRSFWDNHERMLGLFTVTHYVIYYFILTSVIKKWSDWHWLLRTFLLVGGIVMFIALIQQFDNEFLLNTSGDRSAATLGNAIYVGGYGLFLAFIGWLLLTQEKSAYWKVFAGIVSLLGFLGVFFSGSRGALLGLIFGILVLTVFYFINLKENKKIRMFLGIFIALVFLSGATIYIFRENNYVRNLPTIGRLLGTSFSNFSQTTRGMAWGIAINGWQEKPIIGWGPGNYYYAFNKYYRSEFLRYGYQETWFDNAHNIVLNTFTERGLVGVLIYLGIFGSAIFLLWKKYKKNKLNIHVAGVGISFLLAHLVQTITVFENPTSYLYFFFFLAFINFQIISKQEVRDESPINVPVPVGIAAVSVLLMLLLIYSTNINVARANMATLNVIRGVYQMQDIDPLYKKAASIPSPHIDDIRNDVSRTISSNLRNYVKAGKADLSRNLFQLAYGELGKNRGLHPLDVRVHAQQALLAQEAATLSGDKTLLVEAEVVMNDAMEKSPRRQQFIYTLAGIKIQLNKIDEAEALYRQAIKDYEMIGESWWRLALLYSVFGNMEEAVNVINEAKDKGISFGAEGNPVVADILKKNNQQSNSD